MTDIGDAPYERDSRTDMDEFLAWFHAYDLNGIGAVNYFGPPKQVTARTVTQALIHAYERNPEYHQVLWGDAGKAIRRKLGKGWRLIQPEGTYYYFTEYASITDIEHIILQALEQNQDPTRD